MDRTGELTYTKYQFPFDYFFFFQTDGNSSLFRNPSILPEKQNFN